MEGTKMRLSQFNRCDSGGVLLSLNAVAPLCTDDTRLDPRVGG